MSRIDPHADIDELCDALALTLDLASNYGLVGLDESAAGIVDKRKQALAESDHLDVVERAVAIMARSRAVH
jgi:hypothetical protein